jgi:hypothetical protein
MAAKIILQLMLLPLVLLAVPLMFSLAWVQEAISDLKPQAVRAPPQSSL